MSRTRTRPFPESAMYLVPRTSGEKARGLQYETARSERGHKRFEPWAKPAGESSRALVAKPWSPAWAAMSGTATIRQRHVRDIRAIRD